VQIKCFDVFPHFIDTYANWSKPPRSIMSGPPLVFLRMLREHLHISTLSELQPSQCQSMMR